MLDNHITDIKAFKNPHTFKYASIKNNTKLESKIKRENILKLVLCKENNDINFKNDKITIINNLRLGVFDNVTSYLLCNKLSLLEYIVGLDMTDIQLRRSEIHKKIFIKIFESLVDGERDMQGGKNGEYYLKYKKYLQKFDSLIK